MLEWQEVICLTEDKSTTELHDESTLETNNDNEPTEASSATAEGSEVDHWKAQAEEHQNRLLRTLADMENLRRRVRKEQEDLAKYASLKVIENLLPALDNFERALSVDKETVTVESLLQGVNMVYRQMVQVFEQEGLQKMEAQGQPFDPHKHQAVMQADDPNYEPGIVVEELQKGYIFKDRVVRPAMVKVNS